MLDLSKMNLTKSSEAGYEFEVTFPETNEPLGAFISIRGDNSSTVKTYARKKYSEMKVREQQARRRGKDPEDLTLEEMEDFSIEAAVVRTIGWRGITENGVEVVFNKENAERVYRDYPWIRAQVMKESENILNFRPE